MHYLRRFRVLLALSGCVRCSTLKQFRLTGQFFGLAVGAAAGTQFGQGHGTYFAVTEGRWLGFSFGEWESLIR
jgi:hypothetical protein